MTRKELPPCSKPGCGKAASIIFNGVLLCAEHANEAFEQRRAALLRAEEEGSGDQPRSAKKT